MLQKTTLQHKFQLFFLLGTFFTIDFVDFDSLCVDSSPSRRLDDEEDGKDDGLLSAAAAEELDDCTATTEVLPQPKNRVLAHLYEIKGTICVGSARKQSPNVLRFVRTQSQSFFGFFFEVFFPSNSNMLCIYTKHNHDFTFSSFICRQSHQHPQQQVFTASYFRVFHFDNFEQPNRSQPSLSDFFT